MTQENKELLLKDLCARLPYKVKISIPKLFTNKEQVETLNEIFKGKDNLYRVNDSGILIEYIKPYLFPLSSMSDEQKREFYKFFEEGITESANETRQWLRTKRPDETRRPVTIAYVMVHKLVIEWFLKNHFDYSGLIEKGLAIDATGLNIY